MNYYFVHYFNSNDVLCSTYVEGTSKEDAKKKFLASINEDVDDVEVSDVEFRGNM